MPNVVRPFPTVAHGIKLRHYEGFAVYPMPVDVRHGASPAPLFTSATPGDYFAAQNAAQALRAATGRTFYVDLCGSYEEGQA